MRCPRFLASIWHTCTDIGRAVWCTGLVEGMCYLLGTCFSCTQSMAVPCLKFFSKKSQCLKLGCAASINIWTDSVVYDELTINERQKKDENFSKMLGRTLEKRVIKILFLKCSVGKVPVFRFPLENSVIS